MIRKIMRFVIILLIKSYKLFISPVFPPACGYHPTCSEYAIEALREHGALRGLYLAVNRLFRCTPFHKAGFDPVPPSVRGGH